ncbi:PAS/PAC sensor hybrid histidine kinase [Pedobacter westerhofensis]|uniref:histidine kinase n=1 Tax=Pedobacter westerhofensis TaxID=425512 RepID=A0A521FTQ2_9SPHI|nr:PAS domain-containing sensor histidine kinase [Pedobacter westerhofensis]SMO99615.1 PAS/PAC sensor hybrid histidine kinase [Pedobacter westerhofensis]
MTQGFGIHKLLSYFCSYNLLMPKKSSSSKATQSKKGEYSSGHSERADKGKPQTFRQDDAFFRQTLESLEDYAIFTMDLQGIISSWNGGAENMLGYSEQEIIGQDVKILFTPEDVKKKVHLKEMSGSEKNGRHLDERYHLRKDGSRFFVSGKMFALRDPSGKLRGYTKLMRDITHRHVLQETIQQARMYAQGIITTAREPMLVLNEDFTVNTANRSFYKTFKVTKPLTERFNLYQLGNGQWDIPELRVLLADILPLNAVVQDFEVTHTFEKIGSRNILVNGRKLSLVGADSAMILLSFEDITQRKQADQFKNAFIGVASHELRGPVTSIKGYSQILAKHSGKNNDKFTAAISSKINVQSTKLTEMIGHLLDISRIQVGKLQLDKNAFDLNTFIKEVILDLESEITSHTIVLKGGVSRKVDADKFRLGQVINNLISNAVKYSPKANKVIVTLTEEESGRYAKVSVQDFGIGISREDQQNLFQPFSRASNAKTKKIKGIGLGLHISAEIVHAHGGRIEVESKFKTGSSFTFTLPISKNREVIDA